LPIGYIDVLGTTMNQDTRFAATAINLTPNNLIAFASAATTAHNNIPSNRWN